MKNDSQIYKNGDAELALLRASYPFITVMGLMVIGWHFGGFESLATEFDRALARVSAPLAWNYLLIVLSMGSFLLIDNSPSVKLSKIWVLRTIIVAVLNFTLFFWLLEVLK